MHVQGVALTYVLWSLTSLTSQRPSSFINKKGITSVSIFHFSQSVKAK